MSSKDILMKPVVLAMVLETMMEICMDCGNDGDWEFPCNCGCR